MILFRPLAGAVLMSLLLTSATLAVTVRPLVPGGDGASLVGPGSSSNDKSDGVTDLSRETGVANIGGERDRDRSNSSSYSGAEIREAQPGLQTMHFGGVTLACRVGSSARELIVVNESPEPLPSGTRIKWQLKKEGTRGFFAIIGELGGGESLVADNVLDGKVRKDDVCIARVI